MASSREQIHEQTDRKGTSGLQEDLFSVSDATGYRAWAMRFSAMCKPISSKHWEKMGNSKKVESQAILLSSNSNAIKYRKWYSVEPNAIKTSIFSTMLIK